MTSLRDQLLGLGFKASPKPERKPRPQQVRDKAKTHGKGPHDAEGRKKPTTRKAGSGEMDLAKAYAIRAQTEKNEREQQERERQEAVRLRREAQARLDAFLQGVTALNNEAAEIARHFEYGGKIKRIYVTAEQLKSLNAGELGVLQRRGRYLLVTAQVLAEAEAIFPDAVALKVDPDAPVEDDPYGDPKYQVPDDLVW
ncbi:MAG: DUF2058 family protein [Pseudoxanthomonas suwonensis]|nr:DUF2058 family protein [Pseudoxanthomonas suwonensis]